MKLLAFVEAPGHVCFRYRIQPFAPVLAERGWQIEAVALAKGTWARVAQLRRARAADAVILQRKLLPLWQLHVLRKASRRLIYDFDDAMFHRDSHHPKGIQSVQRMARFWAVAYAADAITAGNAFLREQAAAFVPGERVHYVPTCVEPERYPMADHGRRAGEVRLVWIGQRSTLPGVECLEPHLATAAQRLPGLQLRVVSDVFPKMSGVTVVPRLWSSAGEAQELADADVGVSWLPDDAWSRGKCGLKVLQFMAAGLPVVANPVGENCRMVVHGETGYLAQTPAEWADAISRLANDPTLRARFGAAGRQRVEDCYSVKRWQSEFADLIGRFADAPQSPGHDGLRGRRKSALEAAA